MKRFVLLSMLLMILGRAMAQQIMSDESFRIGKLKNGMTYYIRYNNKEKGIADFYIAQRVGSILEEPNQRGLAHFLEHMAFNGSKNFNNTPKSPSIVHWCEAHGIKFGTNLNAYTSVDETVYNVSAVPVKKESVIDSTLLILKDWSHDLNLEDKEIDKERGVIHEEWRTRRAGMASQRLLEEALPIIYKGTKYEDCMPIGKMDIVDNFPYKVLRDYYHKWYRPDLQAIIVVGDVNVDEIEKKIKTTFSDIPMLKDAAKREYFTVTNNDKMIVASLKDKEQPIMLVTLYMKQETTPDAEKSSISYQRAGYVENLISYMVGERLSDMQDQSPKPCLSASARLGRFLVSKTKDAFTLSFGARQENIKGSFDAAIGTIEQIRQHGFTANELERAKAFRQKIVERQFNERNDRKNSYYVRKAQQNFLNNEPITSEVYNKDLDESFRREVSLEEVNKAMRKSLSNKNQVLVVFSPDKPEVKIPSDAQLEEMVLQAQAKTYPPYKEKILTEKLIDRLPTKGSIRKERKAEHGTIELTLGNGLKVYFKKTDFQKDMVSLNLFGEGGTSLYPDSDIINTEFISTAVNHGGVGNFSATDLGKILAGKTVRVNAGVGVETQSINGSASLKDIKTLFELTYLYFTQLRRDDKAFNAELNRMRSFLTNREASPNVSYNDSIAAIVYGNSPRVQPLKASMIDKVNYDRVLEIYKERFSNASNFKMILMGNIDLEKVKPLLEQYIATLPSDGKKESYTNTFPDVRNCNETHRFEKQMNTPLARVTIFYTWNEPYNAKTNLALDIFKRVLSIAYTDSVREEKGGVYGVKVQQSLDDSSNPHALLKIAFDTDPNKYDMIMPIIYEQIQHLADKGPELASLKKVKEYLGKQYEQSIITNDYWTYVIYNQLRHKIDFDKGYKQSLGKISSKDIQRIAQNILKSNRRIEITMVSKNNGQ